MFTWPLPRHVLTAIPFAARADGPSHTQMAAGDHLQLLYNFWLFADTLAGHTPWGYNLYEFNAGIGQGERGIVRGMLGIGEPPHHVPVEIKA